MKFIDLFAGLGGFHNALSQLGHKCVFSSELNSELRELYKKNYNCEIYGDITKVNEKDIPKHDILCAGFPCQPFSHAGKQNGLICDKNGNLFYEIIRILKYHKPKYFILENVANLKNHDSGKTWAIIQEELKKLGYDVQGKILSPHDFGIPHHRRRIFIIGSLKGLESFEWPKENINKKTSLLNILEKPDNIEKIGKREEKILNLWQNFLVTFPKNDKVPSFPIWSMEFGATYPFEKTNPNKMTNSQLSNFKGSFGKPLKNLTKKEQLELLPSYVQFAKHKEQFPDWKIKFIKQNRDFYKEHKKILNKIIPSLQKYPSSFQKFEWNCQGEERNLFNHIIQFRASGIRVKRIDTSPSLISSTSSQIPIIGWEKRYMTPKEASKLQGMENLIMPINNNTAFKALGNALNSDIVKIIAQELLNNN